MPKVPELNLPKFPPMPPSRRFYNNRPKKWPKTKKPNRYKSEQKANKLNQESLALEILAHIE